MTNLHIARLHADRSVTQIDLAPACSRGTHVWRAAVHRRTWNEIGACYGLTKQGAQQRFRAARNQAKAVTARQKERRSARWLGQSE
jgi:hypothetical protein